MALANIDTTVSGEVSTDETALMTAIGLNTDEPLQEAIIEENLFVQGNTNILASEQAVAVGLTQFHQTGDATFNCPDCKGEGMNFNVIFPQGQICQNCKGLGKV
jgi:hypothetical protein